MISNQMNQLPVFQQPQLQILVPQVIPMPQVSTLPPYQLLPSFLPLNTNVKFWDATSTMVVDQLPVGLPMPQVLNNQFVAPIGYSFVLMDVTAPPAATVSDSGESLNVQASETRSVSVGSVRSEQFLARPPAPVSRQATPEPAEPQKRKYKHRSKQEKIEQVHQEVKEKYTALGLYAAEDEVLRGFDTIRVHVKTFRGLNIIDQPLDRILECPSVQILKIATPFSMKNKFQKKGFIVYLKLAHSCQVPIVQQIFKEYEEIFPKCDIALKKEDKLRLDAEKAAEQARAEAQLAMEKTREPQFLSQANSKFSTLDSWDDAWDADLILAPPTMTKSGSLSSVAA